MFLEAIYHRPQDQYAYSYDENTIHIQLRTKKQDIETVEIIYGDPYDWNHSTWNAVTNKMNIAYSDQFFDYWFIAIHPPFKRLRYGFLLFNESKSCVYTEKGFFEQPPLDDTAYYFCFPFINSIDVYKPPKWVENTIWYQIFPERFANGDPTLNPKGTVEWEQQEPTPTIYYGGDFKGVIDHIDYLVNLGITGIYFTPIFKAFSNHKYDTIDYMEIDPQFGTKETFKQLVEECHKQGIKVMLDAVFNHSGYYFAPFQDVLKNGEKSIYKNWFHIHDFPIQTKPIPNYDSFAFEASMPKLNTENPEVKEYLLNVGRYWIKEFNIDGWRLDVANEVDHQFWREFRKEMKKIKPDIYILGEIWHDAMPWLRGDQFDSVMNYPYTDNALRFFAKNETGAIEFIETLQKYLHMYPRNINHILFNLLGSHDTPRIMNIANFNKEKVKLLFAFLLSTPGTPCIYYGDEIGMTGEQDPGCRKCMVWDEDRQDLEMLAFTKKLIQLRKQYPLLGNDGEFILFDANNTSNHVSYIKRNEQEQLLVVFNNNDTMQDIPIPLNLKDKTIIDLWNEKEFAAHTNKISVQLAPYSFTFLLCKA